MTSSVIDTVERWMNRLLMRMAPSWYASQVIRQISLPDYGTLNPADVNSAEWLSLRRHLEHAAEQLEASQQGWNPLAKDLQRLLVHKNLQRHVTLNRLNGVRGITVKSGEFLSLRDWAMAENDLKEFDNADDFDQAIRDFNASEDSPLKLMYREWDGRMYTTALARLAEIGTLMRYGSLHARDINIRASLILESINPKVLDHLRNQYWWFILHRRPAFQIAALLNDCGYPAIAVSDLPGRADMAWLFTTKTNRNLNRVVLNLMTSHSSSGLTELGRYLSRHKYGFRNK